jgi:hypothetical protein
MRLSPPSASEPEPDLEYESDLESVLTQAGIVPAVSAVSEYSAQYRAARPVTVPY